MRQRVKVCAVLWAMGLGAVLAACQSAEVTGTPTATEGATIGTESALATRQADELATLHIQQTVSVGALATIHARGTARAPHPTRTPQPPLPTPPALLTPEIALLPLQPPVLPSSKGLPEGAVARLGDGLFDNIVLSPHGRYIAVVGAPGIRLLDANTFQQVWFSLTNSDPHEVAFSPDGGYLAAIVQGEIVIWDVITGEVLRTFGVDNISMFSLAWSPDSTQIAGGTFYSDDPEYINKVLVWEINTGQIVHVLGNDAGYVSELDWSPATGWLAACVSYSGDVITVWDVATEQELVRIENRSVYSMAFSPDGKTLAFGHGFFGLDTGGPGERATLWDAANGELKFELEAPGLYDVKWSPSGRTIASSQVKGTTTLTIWDAQTGEVLRTVNQHDEIYPWIGGLTDVAWSPVKGEIATAQRDGTVYVWDIASGAAIITLPNAGQQVLWLLSGDKLVTRSATEVTLWDIATQEKLRAVYGSEMVLDVAWSPDGSLIATAIGPKHGVARDSADPFHWTASVKLWDANSGVQIATLWADDVEGAFWTLEFSPDGSKLAAGGGSGRIVVWNVATWGRIHTLTTTAEGDAVLDIAWSPDGQTFATALSDKVVLWDATTGDEIASWDGIGNAVAWSPDGRTLAADTTVSDGYEHESDMVALINVETGDQILYAVTGYWINAIAWSPDGRRLAVGTGDHIFLGHDFITVLDAVTGEVISVMAGHSQPVSELVWSPNGEFIMSTSGASKTEYGAHGYEQGAYSGSVALWDAATGTLLRVFAGHTSEVQGLALSSDGSLLATGSVDGTVILWDVGQ